MEIYLNGERERRQPGGDWSGSCSPVKGLGAPGLCWFIMAKSYRRRDWGEPLEEEAVVEVPDHRWREAGY